MKNPLRLVAFLLTLCAAPLVAPNAARAQLRPPTVPILVDGKDTNYAIPATGAVYVAPNGTTASSGGSLNAPWTLTKAASAAPAGSTLILRGGVYREPGNIFLDKKLTLQAYPHEKPILKGSVVVSSWVGDTTAGGVAIWRNDNWNFSFPPTVGAEYLDAAHPNAAYRDMVFVSDKPLIQVLTKDDVGPGEFYVDAANKKLYIGDNPAAKIVEATSRGTGLFTWGAPDNGIVIRGLSFTHYADEGVNIAIAGVVLENNTFTWNASMGARTSGVNGSVYGRAKDVIVRNNVFRCNGRKGFFADYSDRLLFENNEASDNNVEQFARNFDAAGIKVLHSRDVIFRNNLCERNWSTAMWLDISCVGPKVYRNVVRDNSSQGLFAELTHGGFFAFNVCTGNNVGVMVADSELVRVYNNTLASNNINLIVKDSARVNDNQSEIAEGITWITQGNIVKNNLFSQTGSGSTNAFCDYAYSEPGASSFSFFGEVDNNAYHRASATTYPNLVRWSPVNGSGSAGYTYYKTLREFAAPTGFDTASRAFDGIAASPFFANEAARDFRLLPGGPAVNRGEPLPLDIAREVGVSAAPVSIGAENAVADTAHWVAVSVQTGADNKTRILWQSLGANLANGRAMVWALSATGQIERTVTFGPYADFAPVGISVGADDKTRLVWRHASGVRVAVWNLRPDLTLENGFYLAARGPWDYVDMAVGADNRAHVVWRGLDANNGKVALWTVSTTNGAITSGKITTPGAAWRPRAVSVSDAAAATSSDNRVRVLLTHQDGSVALWKVAPDTNVTEAGYVIAARTGYTCADCAVGADNKTRLLWNHVNSAILLSSVTAGGAEEAGATVYGPYASIAWARRLAAGGDTGKTRLLWNKPDGSTSVWTLSSPAVMDGSQPFAPQ